MNGFTDSEYLEVVAKSFEPYAPCPKHGKITDEIRRIAGRVARYDKGRETLTDLLEFRKSKDFRAGLLQAAVSFGIIGQREWDELADEYIGKK